MSLLPKFFSSPIFALFLAFAVFGAIQLFQDTNVSDEVKNQIIDQTQIHPIHGSIFVKTLDELTPTLSYKLPFTEKKIFLINEFPLFSWFHLVFIIALIWIAYIIAWILKVNKWKLLLIFIILLILGYFIASALLLLMYNIHAQAIGFTKEQATELRHNYNNQFDNVYLPIVLFSLFSALKIFLVITGRMTNSR